VTEIPGVCYTSPYAFSVRQRCALALLPPLIAGAMKLLSRSARWEIRGMEHWDAVQQTQGRAIVAFWHETLGLAAWHHRGSGGHTLTSYSYDGEMAARVVRRYGMMAIRGSSSRGGSDALRSFEAAFPHLSRIGFTLDGPRGPRRVAKPGIAILAARLRSPVLPQAFAVAPSWRLHSWDRFPIPKPFAHVIAAYGPAIPSPKDESPEAVETMRAQVEEALNRLHAEIEGELNDGDFSRHHGAECP